LPPLHRAALSGDLDAMRAVVENLPVRTRYISHRLCLPQAFRPAAKLSCEYCRCVASHHRCRLP
jgi:hypothetical protein